MRKWAVVLLMVCCMVPAGAQQMGVEQFTRVRRYLWNRSKVAVDKRQALLDLKTDEKGFAFLANGKEPAEAEEGEGIITVKLPHHTRHITITHPDYGQYTFRVPVKWLKRKKHYSSTLNCTNPNKEYKLQQQWVVFQIEPKDAVVTIDSTVCPVRDGQLTKRLPLGKHAWQVEAPFYETVADTLVLTDTAKLSLSLRLQPFYSYLTVKSERPWFSIHVDGQPIGQLEAVSMRLAPGSHRLSAWFAGNCYYDRTITVKPAEKAVAEILNKDLRLLSAHKQPLAMTTDTMMVSGGQQALPLTPVVLNAPDADTELWIDREQMGTGQWSGTLTQGYHQVSTRKGSSESKPMDLWVADGVPVEASLATPQASMAMLNIHGNVVGASIFVNGLMMGHTPCIIPSLPAHTPCTVRVEKEGYRPIEKTVRMKGNELSDLHIKMKRK